MASGWRLPSYTSEEMRRYMERYRQRRRDWAKAELGGKCVVCGTTEGLEFDHIDPSTKINSIANMLTSNQLIFEAEVRKCQLLCRRHHLEKTIAEGSTGRGRIRTTRHGTTYMYSKYKCRCAPCRAAKKAERSTAR